MSLTPLVLLLSSLLILSRVFAQTNTGPRNCSILLSEGHPASGEHDCRVYPGQCASNESTIQACNASGGVCFDDSFCCPSDWQPCGAGFATVSVCYDPDYYSCCGVASSPGGSGPVLCDNPKRPDRTNTCMRATGQLPSCAPLTPQSPTGSPPYKCYVSGNEQVYDNNTYVCIEGTQLCPRSAFLGCSYNLTESPCFNPSEYTCDGELLFDQSRIGTNGVSTFLYTIWLLCPLTTPYLCGGECYDPMQYVCYSENLATLKGWILCPVDTPYLCGANCYQNTQYRCVNGQLEQV